MATVILLRHGRTSANARGALAGRTPGVHLDDVGRTQAERAAERLAVVPLAALVSSPLERCRETARAVASRQAAGAAGRTGQGPHRVRLRRVAGPAAEGARQGGALEDRADQPVGGDVPRRGVAAADAGARRRRRTPSGRRGRGRARPGAVWVAVSHGDLIKSVLADALGMHLDLFQRIQVDPASISIDPLHRRPALRARHQHPRGRPLVAGRRRPKKGTAGKARRPPARRSAVAPDRCGHRSDPLHKVEPCP